MPGAVIWPGVVHPQTTTDVLVSTMDIFPTVLEVAGVSISSLGENYAIDGKDMSPVLRRYSNTSQHKVLLHYCGFNAIAARVYGRWKVWWAMQNWYAHCQRCDALLSTF